MTEHTQQQGRTTGEAGGLAARLAAWLTPPYSGLVGAVAFFVGVATEFTNPASLPVLVNVFGPTWTKGLVSVCALVVLVSNVPQVKAALTADPVKPDQP